MNATSLSVGEVFGSASVLQYVLPHFQREFAWEKEEWQTLFDDAMEIYRSDSDPRPEHFMGSLVVIQDQSTSGKAQKFTLVDGQQRLTSISLLLCALRDTLGADDPLRASIEKLMVNPDEEGRLRYKILPTTKYSDRQAYFAIVDNELNPAFESGIVNAWKHYQRCLRDDTLDIDSVQFFNCIANSMQVVFIKLYRSEQAHRIFESLNAKGRDLTEADLVRNYVAMKLPLDRQERAFNEHWAKIDNLLQEKRKVARMGELSAFLRHYLAMGYGVLPKTKRVFTRFRAHIERYCPTPEEFISELRKLNRFAKFYDKLVRPMNEPNLDIRLGLERLNIVAESVCYPLLLKFYDSHEEGRISDTEFVKALEIVENYTTRRFLAGARTNSLNNVFAAVPYELDVENFLPSLTELLRSKGYPRNSDIRQSMAYKFKYTKRSRERVILILNSIERYLSRESDGYAVLKKKATIEHIMPQSLDQPWKDYLGSNWEQIHDEHLDKMGNVTLVTQEWNTAMTNGPFATKKEKLAEHVLRINKDYFSQDIQRWDGDAIALRTDWLAQLAVEVWQPLGGFSPARSDIDNARPTSLTIDGQSIEVDSWRQVLIQTVEEMADRFDDFGEDTARFESFLSHTDASFLSSHQLRNGYWLKLNHSNKKIYEFCKQFSLRAGLDNRDWNVEYE